jgi:hypothetical protein
VGYTGTGSDSFVQLERIVLDALGLRNFSVDVPETREAISVEDGIHPESLQEVQE